jgi:hypothetical protein
LDDDVGLFVFEKLLGQTTSLEAVSAGLNSKDHLETVLSGIPKLLAFFVEKEKILETIRSRPRCKGDRERQRHSL